MRKIRKSKAYLILSSAHLGVSEDIAKIYARAAAFYGAETYHLGGFISEKESKAYLKLRDKRSNVKAQLQAIDNQIENGAFETVDEAESAYKRSEKLQLKFDILDGDIKVITTAERERINILLNSFGKVNAILAPDLYTDEATTIDGLTTVDSGMALSKYMYLSAVSPSGERTTAKPITKRAMDFLKQHGKFSWIVAHPVPAVETMEKPGLNNAHKFYTVGSMRHVISPRSHKQFYQGHHLPCAMMVLVDEQTGEYHAKQMHIDYVTIRGVRKPMVLDDGMVFMTDKHFDVGSEDRGTLFTDDHAPYTHQGTLGAGRVLNELHRPAWLVNNGDAADFTSVCPYANEFPGDRENLRLEDDIQSMRNLLDAQCNVNSIVHKILIDSNHHEWVTKFVAANPCLKKTFDWHTLATKRFPDWDVYIREAGDNKIFKFGDYTIRHGDKESLEKGARMSENGKYACGHHHRYYTFQRAMSIGCGSGLGPKFIGNQVTAWVSQVTSMTKYLGIAAINPKIVLHDEKRRVSRFAYRNEIFEVDYHALPKIT